MSIVMVIPVRNESAIIKDNVSEVIKFMKSSGIKDWHILVAENGSTDDTVEKLKKLSNKYPKKILSYQCLHVKSKGDAIKMAWLSRKADVYIHMDADLSTDLKHIPELVGGIEDGNDVVVGSRYLKDSEVERSLKRSVISFFYNTFMRTMFSLNVKDLQCGFKAINKKTLDEIVRQSRYLSDGFLDTEMLILASKKKFRIKEIPIKWKDDRKSKFNLLSVSLKFFANALRVKRDLMLGRYE